MSRHSPLAGSVCASILVCEVTSCVTFSDLLPRFRLDTSVWEDRLTLAKLREKVQAEDGRLVLRIEQEDWKVTSS